MAETSFWRFAWCGATTRHRPRRYVKTMLTQVKWQCERCGWPIYTRRPDWPRR